MPTAPAGSGFAAPTTAIVTGSDSASDGPRAWPSRSRPRRRLTWHEDEAGDGTTPRRCGRHGPHAVVAQPRHDPTWRGCGDVIDQLAEQLGGVDVFVNNAGTGDNSRAAARDDAGPVAAHRGRRPGRRVRLSSSGPPARMVVAGRGGRIIAITSVHEHQPRVGSSATTPPSTGSAGSSRPWPSSSASTASPPTRWHPGRSPHR
jgi:NAD(P)-dependent dehydrogenase (short-subunit alcohol dehydrogenase family)